MLARITLDWGLIRVKFVPLLQYLQMAASQSLSVNVMLGTPEKMEARAHSVTQALIKIAWGQPLVQAVHLIQSLQLAAPKTPHVNVTLDTRE